MSAIRVYTITFLLTLIFGVSATYPANADALSDASLELSVAAKRLELAGQGVERTVVLGQAITAYESALSEVRALVISAGAEERRIAFELAQTRQETTRLLAALQSIARNPAPLLDMHPSGPVAASRAGAMIAQLTPALGDQAAELSEKLDALERARELQRKGISDLSQGLVRLDIARKSLATEIEDTPERQEPDSLVSAALEDAGTLQELSAAIAKAPRRVVSRSVGNSGVFSWPVVGRLTGKFNARDAAGVRRPGIVVAASPFSLVLSPANGMIRYAGPFLDYQNIVILEADNGAMIMLAGLAGLNISNGKPVKSGTPLGMLGGRSPEVEEYVKLRDDETGSGLRETLYIEIRHGRGPVDPVPWFDGKNG